MQVCGRVRSQYLADRVQRQSGAVALSFGLTPAVLKSWVFPSVYSFSSSV